MTKYTIGLALLLAGIAGNIAAADTTVDTAFQTLQSAEASKDAALIRKAAVEAYRLADAEICQGMPADSTDKQAWEERAKYDRDIETHAEYALYAAALSTAPATGAELFATLEQLNPKSKYLDMGYGFYFKLLEQTGQRAKITSEADKALAAFPRNADALSIASDAALTRKQNDRALALAKRLVAAVKSRPKPEGASEAQWESTKTAMLARGYWISGVVEGTKNDYQDADVDLRAALPLIQSNQTMAGPALFYLGVANYNLARQFLNKAQMREAIQFSDKAAAIKGTFSQQAYENSMVMKAELAHWR